MTKEAHHTPTQPIVPLYAYQQQWLRDQSKLKIACWSRQSGKSFAATLEAVLHCFHTPQSLWVMISRGHRQATELLARASQHLYTIQRVIRHRWGYDWQPTTKQSELVFPNGSRIIALPANADTVRGYSGHIILDEFATHGDAEELWRAAVPIATRGYNMRVLSTPKGSANRFARLWKDPQWSQHFVTVDHAIEAGVPLDKQRLRTACQDPETWQQEFECRFLDTASAYLALDLIASAQSPDCLQPLRPNGEYYGGIDVGRQHDLTVLWVLEQQNEMLITRMVECLRGVSFRSQFEALSPLVSRCQRVGVDASGLGMQLAEELHQSFPTIVEPVQFAQSIPLQNTGLSIPVKTHLAGLAKRTLEEQRVLIPDDPTIQAEFHELRRVMSPTGTLRFDIARTPDGHGDRFWAFALALAAATHAPTHYNVRWA